MAVICLIMAGCIISAIPAEADQVHIDNGISVGVGGSPSLFKAIVVDYVFPIEAPVGSLFTVSYEVYTEALTGLVLEPLVVQRVGAPIYSGGCTQNSLTSSDTSTLGGAVIGLSTRILVNVGATTQNCAIQQTVSACVLLAGMCQVQPQYFVVITMNVKSQLTTAIVGNVNVVNSGTVNTVQSGTVNVVNSGTVNTVVSGGFDSWPDDPLHLVVDAWPELVVSGVELNATFNNATFDFENNLTLDNPEGGEFEVNAFSALPTLTQGETFVVFFWLFFMILSLWRGWWFTAAASLVALMNEMMEPNPLDFRFLFLIFILALWLDFIARGFWSRHDEVKASTDVSKA